MASGKKLLYARQAQVASAIAHPLRVAVLEYLQDGEHCVCDIAERVGAERSNVSRHLAVMVKAGLLDCRKEGLKVIYRVKCRCVYDFLRCVSNVVREQARENERILNAL